MIQKSTNSLRVQRSLYACCVLLSSNEKMIPSLTIRKSPEGVDHTVLWVLNMNCVCNIDSFGVWWAIFCFSSLASKNTVCKGNGKILHNSVWSKITACRGWQLKLKSVLKGTVATRLPKSFFVLIEHSNLVLLVQSTSPLLHAAGHSLGRSGPHWYLNYSAGKYFNELFNKLLLRGTIVGSKSGEKK